MQDIDLSKLSLEELKRFQKELSRAIEEYERYMRREALSAAREAAREHGYKLSELYEPAQTTKKANPPKYRHPENPSLTWTGKGRPPKWLKEALAAGHPMDDIRVR